jgi:hypothetical protein
MWDVEVPARLLLQSRPIQRIKCVILETVFQVLGVFGVPLRAHSPKGYLERELGGEPLHEVAGVDIVHQLKAHLLDRALLVEVAEEVLPHLPVLIMCLHYCALVHPLGEMIIFCNVKAQIHTHPLQALVGGRSLGRRRGTSVS